MRNCRRNLIADRTRRSALPSTASATTIRRRAGLAVSCSPPDGYNHYSFADLIVVDSAFSSLHPSRSLPIGTQLPQAAGFLLRRVAAAKAAEDRNRYP